MLKKLFILFCIPAVFFSWIFAPKIWQKIEQNKLSALSQASSVNSSPTTTQIRGTQKVKYPEDYTLVLVGDSMTERLGNSDEIRAYLREDYPDKTFEVLNYGYGSTNILSIQERLEKTTFFNREFRPITDIDFDLILIESMGNNPLSHYPLEEGLKKQTEALDKINSTIQTSNPDAKIVFVATIAPNKFFYGKGKVDLSSSQREQWVNERIAYIKNHINYAQKNNIPLINIYEKSLNKDGVGSADYLSTDDYIHPSPSGIYFISRQIADYIFENKLLN